MPDLGIDREKIVFVSGIGCSSRFPYYMNTYGFHSIHGRAPAIATGISATRPDLKVFVITGDGDGLSIGGNHLIHAMRRNANLTIVLFNNQIYGLTKGQYSPTSEVGKITKSTPSGSLDYPFNPVSVALGAEATFVARTIDTEREHLSRMIELAARHEGTVVRRGVSELQHLQRRRVRRSSRTRPRRTRSASSTASPSASAPTTSAASCCGPTACSSCVDVADVGEENILVHDAHREDPALAFMLSRLAHTPDGPTPIGLFRQVQRPVYGQEMQQPARRRDRATGRGRPRVADRRPRPLGRRRAHLRVACRRTISVRPDGTSGADHKEHHVRILLVSDNPKISVAVMSALMGERDTDMIEVSTPQRAVALLDEGEQFDVVAR